MKFISKRIKAFAFAFSGIGKALKTETAFIVHALAAIGTILAGLYFHVSACEWCVLIICISLVFAAELFNTALERLCDLYSKEKSEHIAFIKDVSAAAVLFTVLGSVICGWIVFSEHLF